MSGTQEKKRCPNCAWAIGLADKMALPYEESWILTIIAEHVDPDMCLHATMAELSKMTRMKPVTLSKHVRSLAAREVGITMRRGRDGYHYKLLRKPTDQINPKRDWKPWNEEPIASVAEEELQNLQVSGQVITDQELQNLQVLPPVSASEPAKSAIQELQNLQLPIKSPLEDSLVESKEERSSLRSLSARVKAPASPRAPIQANVVALNAHHAIVDAWNVMATQQGLPKVLAMGKTRQRSLDQRIKEVGIEQMMRAIEAVSESDFLTGGGDRGWRAGFDFLLQPKSLIKLLEGQYADRDRKPLFRHPGNQIAEALGMNDKAHRDKLKAGLTVDRSGFQREAQSNVG